MKYLSYHVCWRPNSKKIVLEYCEYLIEIVHHKINELNIVSPEKSKPYISKINEITESLMIMEEEISQKKMNYYKKYYIDYLAYKIDYDNYKDRFDKLSDELDELFRKLNIK